MWSLEAAYRPDRRSLFDGTPTVLLTVLTLTIVVTAFASTIGVVPEVVVRILGVAAGHGALLALALAWARSDARAVRGLEAERSVDIVSTTSAAALPAGALVVAAAAATHAMGA